MKCCPWQKKMVPAKFIAKLWVFAGVTASLAQKSSRQAKFQEERRAQEWDFVWDGFQGMIYLHISLSLYIYTHCI